MKNYLNRATSFLLAFALLVSLTLPFAMAAPEETAEGEEAPAEEVEVYQVPDITIDAKAALLVDLDTGQILLDQNAKDKNYPASITKIMTALLTLEAVGREEISLNQEVTVPEEAFSDMDEESSTAGLKPGEVITVENLLYCLMVASANEAANTLAITVSGSVDAFVSRMNKRARELGMDNTHFVNPHGLHDDNHYTTAYDIYLMAKEGMTHAVFRDIVSTKQYTVPASDVSGERILSNTNGLLTGYHYPGYSIKGTIGIKTGSTGQAGYCLCAAVKRDGHTLISVVLGAKNPEIPHKKDDVTRMQFVESARLQEWGFENFSYVTLLDADATKEEVAVRSSFQDNHVILRPSESVSALIPGPYNKELTELKLELEQDPISQSVSAGEALGTMTVSYGGQVYGTVDMVAVSDVSYSPFLAFVNNVNAVLGNIYIRILLLAALVFAVVGLGRRLLNAKREELAAVRAKGRAVRQARMARRAQNRQEREEVNAQRQVEYEVRKKEERQLKAQRAREREEERVRQAEEARIRREEEARRRQEERRREERAQRQWEEQERRRKQERRHSREEESARYGGGRSYFDDFGDPRSRERGWDDYRDSQRSGWSREDYRDNRRGSRDWDDYRDTRRSSRDWDDYRDTRRSSRDWDDYRDEPHRRDSRSQNAGKQSSKNKSRNQDRRGDAPPRRR